MQKYFSWGDIKGQNKNGNGSYSFSENNYKAGICGKGHTLTGDIPQGNATYDAARANMGSPWKMFTQAQGQELINGTNSTWTTINGVNGRKFTSKTDSSKYIFLPAGGFWEFATYTWNKEHGYSWSAKWSSLYNAYQITFTSKQLIMTSGMGTSRSYGHSIRPIR